MNGLQSWRFEHLKSPSSDAVKTEMDDTSEVLLHQLWALNESEMSRLYSV